MGQDIAIGIDLGTSNSCAAAVVKGQPRVLKNGAGEVTTASVVHFAENGTITVGNRAKANIILDPKHTVASAKRLIGRYIFSQEVQKAKAICRYEIVGDDDGKGVRIKVREELFSLPEVSAFVLTEMKKLSEAELGRPVTKAVITVPAYFNDNQRQSTKDAGRIAGLEVLRILNEPTAAALAYGYGRNLKQRVAVYDLGGGTFDVSVLEIDGDVFEVLATCGDTYLGGDDFDDRLIDLLADLVQEQHRVNVRSDPIAHERLKQAAELAKIGLSKSDRAPIEITELAQSGGKSFGLSYTLERQEFAKLTMDLVQRTFKVCDEAMQNASLTVRDLDGVILVGGMTRLPTIRDAVRQYFGRDPEVGVNPDEVVAVGAAIHAASLGAQDSDSFLLDVTPLSLRLGIAGGMSEPVIEKNSPIPIEQTRVFMPARDNQATVSVDIYQGESRRAADNELLGSFAFTGFTPGPRQETQIEVSFAISAEGIVKVSARDPKTGTERNTTVSMTSGLSEDELRAIMERNRTEDVALAAAPAVAPKPRPGEAAAATAARAPTKAKAAKPAAAPKAKPAEEAIPLPELEDLEASELAISDEDLLDLPGLEQDAQAAQGDEPDRSSFDTTNTDLHGGAPADSDLKDLLTHNEVVFGEDED
jgi:molecular chaperone DnaK